MFRYLKCWMNMCLYNWNTSMSENMKRLNFIIFEKLYMNVCKNNIVSIIKWFDISNFECMLIYCKGLNVSTYKVFEYMNVWMLENVECLSVWFCLMYHCLNFLNLKKKYWMNDGNVFKFKRLTFLKTLNASKYKMIDKINIRIFKAIHFWVFWMFEILYWLKL